MSGRQQVRFLYRIIGEGAVILSQRQPFFGLPQQGEDIDLFEICGPIRIEVFGQLQISQRAFEIAEFAPEARTGDVQVARGLDSQRRLDIGQRAFVVIDLNAETGAVEQRPDIK